MNPLKKYSNISADFDRLTGEIIDSIFHVHSELGPGLLEKIYEEALCNEFKRRGISFETQKRLDVIYKGDMLPSKYSLDMIVENVVILELKSVDKLIPVHEAQLISYLKLANVSVGFLVNFNVPLIKNGIKRLVSKSLLRSSVLKKGI